MQKDFGMKILVTGASGFIGSFIVEHAIKLGYDVWAGVRANSSRQWLTDKRIHFIGLDFSHPELLIKTLEEFHQKEERWDYVVHAAGATKTKDEATFFETNFEATRQLVKALQQLGMTPQRFVMMSSLSVLGALRQELVPQAGDRFYAEMTAADEPEPNTAYGRSKYAAEKFLHEQKDFPYIILRPTGVYGPREKDYYLMAKSIKQHVDFAVGFKPQEITFIYVQDLVEAVFLILDKGEVTQSYLLSDGNTYNSRTFSDLLQKEMGINNVIHLKAPLWLLRMICCCGELCGKLTGKISVLNIDKYNILKQRNWRCNIQPAIALGFKPRFDLEAGVKQTVAWYKQKKWI